jgi:hypothetical protein
MAGSSAVRGWSPGSEIGRRGKLRSGLPLLSIHLSIKQYKIIQEKKLFLSQK